MTQLSKYQWLGSITLFVYLALTALIITADTSAQSSTWTVQTLKEYVDQRFNAMQQAVDKAEQATEKRFESVNEFRNTLADQQTSFEGQQRLFIPREEYEAGHASLERTVTELKERLDKLENLKVGGSTTLYIIIAVVSFLAAVLAFSKNFISSIYQKTKEK